MTDVTDEMIEAGRRACRPIGCDYEDIYKAMRGADTDSVVVNREDLERVFDMAESSTSGYGSNYHEALARIEALLEKKTDEAESKQV